MAPVSADAERIFGRVHKATNAEINGICVEAFSVGGGSTAAPAASTFSDFLFPPNHNPGRFTLNVSPGQYKVRYAGCGGPPNDQFQPEFLDHRPTFGSAFTVNVGAGSNVDLGVFQLTPHTRPGRSPEPSRRRSVTRAKGVCAVALDANG